MAQPMNTFAVVLLAFPFYLAIKGRLAYYVTLAKPSNASAAPTVGASSSQQSTTPAPSASPVAAAPAQVSSSNLSSASNTQQMSDLFANATELFNMAAESGIFG